MFKSIKLFIKSHSDNLSVSSVVAGAIVALVGMTSSAVIVFQAASSAGLSPIEASSWMGSLCLGMGILTIFYSFYYKTPVLFAWSTPGAAILVTGLKDFLLPEAIGAFLFSAFLIFLFGVTGLFEKLINKIPQALASALLAGVLFHFSTDVFVAFKSQTLLIGLMLISYVFSRKYFPRSTMLIVLIIGFAISLSTHLLRLEEIKLSLAHFYFVTPVFSFAAILGIGIPLFIVTMSSQNLTGVTVMKSNNFHIPISPLIWGSGLMNLVTAFFGGFTINLAAITAAIAMGEDAHPHPEKRYWAAVISGIFYLIIGLFAGTVTSLFAAFPKEMIMGIAGMALFGTISACLDRALNDFKNREAAFITFAITASGMTLLGINSAFWGLIAGGLVQFFLVTVTQKLHSRAH